MKKSVAFSLLLCLVFTSNAQEITELKETKISVESNTFLSSLNSNEYTYSIRGSYARDFEANAIRFLEENFDFQEFLKMEKIRPQDFYEITLSSSKGYLIASYSKEGELINTFQKFKNILVPSDIRQELYKNYKGWAMVSNIFKAYGENNTLNSAVYHIKLKKENQVQKIKISSNQRNFQFANI